MNKHAYRIAAALYLCIGCAMSKEAPVRISIMTYNAQMLFDAVDNGGEYPDFRVSSGAWSEAKYKKRLASLATVMAAAAKTKGGPSIVVVQELENLKTAAALAAALGEAADSEYPYIIISPDEEALLSCAVISKYPFTMAKAHRIRKPDGAPVSVPRFVLETELSIEGKKLTVIAAHLKSKLGGDFETERERRAATAFLSALAETRFAANPNAALIIAGDFNENPDEFERVEQAWPTALMDAEAGAGEWLLISGNPDKLSAEKPPVFFCPWFGAEGYSYKYKGNEERIDQIFLSKSLLTSGGAFLFESFSCDPPEFAVQGDGTPLKWNTREGSGYSDHLPVSVTFSIQATY